MAVVLHRDTKQIIRSANTADYRDGNWLINPDMSRVRGVSQRYWKVIGNEVYAMTAAERIVVDNELAVDERRELESILKEVAVGLSRLGSTETEISAAVSSALTKNR